jgi:glycerol-3-phosphate acyltransferase PlsY
MLELGTKTLLAYLLGALLGSLIIGRLRNVDIRTMGSGNAGGTNALRTQGLGFGLLVLAIDIGKGVIAVGLLPSLKIPGIDLDPRVDREWLLVCCAGAVIVGHVYPVWFDFRGGKGAATVVGAVTALHSWALIPLLATWVLVIALTGFVGLATMLSGVSLVAAVWFFAPEDKPFLLFAILAAAFIVYTHRSNIQRMRAGTENRARRLWLLRPRST